MPKQVNGWHLPIDDSYFTKFVQGAPPKENGFQRDHLLEAFKHVRGRKVAIDVGAHVGFWTVDLAAWFERVYAFEPHPATYECLRLNLADRSNVHLMNAAVGAKAGSCEIMGEVGKNGKVNTGSFFVDPEKSEGTIPIVTLDSMEGLEACDLLKIDVEGYEFQVLTGARMLIKRHKPVVIMETEKRFSDRFGVPYRKADRWLRDQGYKVVAKMRPDTVFVPV